MGRLAARSALLAVTFIACPIPSVGFAGLPHAPQQQLAHIIQSEAPTIITIDGLLTRTQVCDAQSLVLECDESLTSDYQEDIFRPGAEAEEDEHFRTIAEKCGVDVPDIYTSPLESFVWVVTNHPDAIPEEDVIRGANAIQRREAAKRWESEEGKELLGLSMDDAPFEKAGRRFAMPDVLRTSLVGMVPRLLRTDPEVVEWTLRDSTVVVYEEGEGQVPHVDPCDATILVYLSGSVGHDNESTESNCEGGDTCFPLAGCRVPPHFGRVLLFFSSESPNSNAGRTVGKNEESERRERSPLSLHHGGRVDRGRKIVAQIMLDANVRLGVSSWLDLVSL